MNAELLVESTLAKVVRQRRTIDQFKPDPPPPQLIRRAIELARWAPNHHLTEPWRFYLLGTETAEAIAQLNAGIVAAKSGGQKAAAKLQRWQAIPGWLAMTCQRSQDPLTAREDYAACCCAMQNLALLLWEQGVGMKWTTGAVTRDPRLYELLWIDPQVEELVGLVWYGYPDQQPDAQRKPLAQILVELP